MADVVIPVSKIRRARPTPKGRMVDPAARMEVRAALEGAPLEAQYLIENLHRIQDRFGHISAAHLNALAEAMKLAMAEVYEVATFYHHFDVVKEGEAAPPAVTVRVCETLSCQMAGAQQLLDKLPGLVGAGFPAGRKWRIVRGEPGPRLMAVNIDEGEPGTFKDRHYLERDPHRFLEGMLIAAWAVGIEDIYVYLRDEYHACREMLERELAALIANA